MHELFGMRPGPDDPRWVLLVFVLGLGALWYNHWTGRWWLYRSRARVIGLTLFWLALFAALLLLD